MEIEALDTGETLSLASELRALSARAEARLLEVAAHFADLHGRLDDEGAGVSLPGMEQLVRFGGEGTPEVAEFAPAELGAELAMSPFAARMLVADALDLRHRLPRLWGRVRAGEVKPWIGRKAAEATRDVSVEVAAVVDRRVTRWAHSLSWGRLEKIVEAAVIAADPEGAAAAAEEAERSQGVWLRPSNDHGVKDIHIRTEAAAAIWFDASVDRVADGLGVLGDTDPKDVRRARAVGVLAQPQQALDLFDDVAAQQTGEGSRTGDSRAAKERSEGRQAAGGQPTTLPPATLYIHLDQDAFSRDEGGVARFEGVGPITLDQAKKWLRHCAVTVKPVIDLADQAPVDGYEVPDRLREATHLRSPVDVFPYGTNTTRRKDADHTDPYIDPGDGGPPDQTRLDNLSPLTRFHHRIKTHGRWRVEQPFNGVFVWRSPHGRLFLVDHTGTHPIGDTAA